MSITETLRVSRAAKVSIVHIFLYLYATFNKVNLKIFLFILMSFGINPKSNTT